MTSLYTTLDKISRTIDAFSERTGHVVAWLVLLLALVIGYDVAMRSLFQIGSVALQELEWHLFALIFLLGAAYTLKQDEHVCVDIIYSSKRLSDRQRAWIDVFGTLFFLFPFCSLVIVSSLPFVESAFVMQEGSSDAGGLPFRYLLKAVIPLGFALVMLQGVAKLLRAICVVTGPDTSPDAGTDTYNTSPSDVSNKS